MSSKKHDKLNNAEVIKVLEEITTEEKLAMFGITKPSTDDKDKPKK